MTQYVAQLDKNLTSTWKFANALATRTKEVAQAIFEFAQTVSFLGQSEGDAIGNALCQVSNILFGDLFVCLFYLIVFDIYLVWCSC